MKAGRELDALVAEKMGFFKRITREDGTRFWMDMRGLRIFHGRMMPFLPPYSTDLTSAWEVADKAKLFERYLLTKYQGRWYWQDHSDRDPFLGKRGFETAPLAICFAALQANIVP